MSRHIVPIPGADPGGEAGVRVDTRGAVLLDAFTAAVAHVGEDGGMVALDLAGRVNKQDRRGEQLYLMDGEGAASLVGELIATFIRNGQGEEFMRMLGVQIEARAKREAAGATHLDQREGGPGTVGGAP